MLELRSHRMLCSPRCSTFHKMVKLEPFAGWLQPRLLLSFPACPIYG